MVELIFIIAIASHIATNVKLETSMMLLCGCLSADVLAFIFLLANGGL